MAIRLNINGGLALTFLDVYSNEPISESEVKVILGYLQSGGYVISLASKTVDKIDNLGYPIYRFEFEVEDDTEYEFEDEN
jgi:hypothetical protein